MATQDYRVIVVGTDGSPLAAPTVTRASRIAARTGAELIIVCAWTDPGPRAGAILSSTALPDSRGGVVFGRSAAKSVLKEAVRIAVKKKASVKEALLVDGDAAAALVHVADAHAAELIVIGASAPSGLTERLLGTVASEVGGRARCDVLLVRTAPTEDPETGAVDVDVPELVTEAIRLPK